METMRLGRTDLQVTRTAFGVLPLQRVEMDEAVSILRRAQEAGITFYDTARAYTDSEAKIGAALAGVRDRVVLATKTHASDRAGVLDHLATSLEALRTDHVDLLQLHNPSALPDPDDPDSTYAGLVEARKAGKVRFIGITAHRLDVAAAAARSGLYDTVQFPISPISTAEELELVEVCRQADVGLIAMKALCGGLFSDARTAFAFFRQFDNVVPIWGIQRMGELEEFLALDAAPPAFDARDAAAIGRYRRELGGDFCRGCGYCLPCPADIPIPMAARMSLLLRRAVWQSFMTDDWRRKMARIEDCTGCGHCTSHCPYGLDTPELLKAMLADYRAFAAEHT
ncbi:MAG: 4Fe-4S dicluster domain-containing protein [Planctomycetes bacterium]|nr:4Fe-4S dicluster domain-containing protein [Planctomycetota bacterium]